MDWADAGLKVSCVVRLKLFTLDNRLIARRIGALSDLDRSATRIALARLIAL
jgi:mRNA interferase MazF